MADVLLLCGDLTAYGLPERLACSRASRGRGPAPDPGRARQPRLRVGAGAGIMDILRSAACGSSKGRRRVGGVGFAGAKGYGGGFGQRAIRAWGEDATSSSSTRRAGSAEVESGLARLGTAARGRAHYAPILETVRESGGNLPFRGSSRLEGALDRYKVAACFHGHAHRGRPEGRTAPASRSSTSPCRCSRPPSGARSLRVWQLAVQPPSRNNAWRTPIGGRRLSVPLTVIHIRPSRRPGAQRTPWRRIGESRTPSAVLAAVLAPAACPASPRGSGSIHRAVPAGSGRAGRAALRALGARIVLGLDAHEPSRHACLPPPWTRLRANPNVASWSPTHPQAPGLVVRRVVGLQ